MCALASYAPESIKYAQKRYTDETRRLYGVLDTRLTGHQYLAGDDESDDGYTIAGAEGGGARVKGT